MALLDRLPGYTLPLLLSVGTVGLLFMTRRTPPIAKLPDTPIAAPPPPTELAQVSPAGALIYQGPALTSASYPMSGPRLVQVISRGPELSHVRAVPDSASSTAPIPWSEFWIRTSELLPVAAAGTPPVLIPRCAPNEVEIIRGDPRAVEGRAASLPWRDDGAGNFWKCVPGFARGGGMV